MPEDMSEYMPEDMSDRMPEDMSEYMPEDMPDRMPEDMSDRVPEDMPDRMPEDLPDRMPEDMPEDMPDHMPEDMPDRMSNRMSEDMSDRMPEDLPVRKCINVMVGITRSKVICLARKHPGGLPTPWPVTNTCIQTCPKAGQLWLGMTFKMPHIQPLNCLLIPPFRTIPVIESEKWPIWFDDASHIVQIQYWSWDCPLTLDKLPSGYD